MMFTINPTQNQPTNPSIGPNLVDPTSQRQRSRNSQLTLDSQKQVLTDGEPFFEETSYQMRNQLRDEDGPEQLSGDGEGNYADSRARCSFRVLRARSDGVGDYHANNHIGFFRAAQEPNVELAVRELMRNFPTIFSRGNSATAVSSRCRHYSEPTVKFTAHVPGPDLHDDWVAMRRHNRYFYARTLQRGWRETWERLAGVPFGAAGMIGSRLGWEVNRRHFLAGRRSWTFGYLPDQRLFFVETAALERYSHRVFAAMEGPMNLRGQVIAIWIKMIQNVAHHFGWPLVPYVPPHYLSRGGVAYKYASATRGSTILRSSWFSRVATRHPALTTY